VECISNSKRKTLQEIESEAEVDFKNRLKYTRK
jgi:hypothetical protein